MNIRKQFLNLTAKINKHLRGGLVQNFYTIIDNHSAWYMHEYNHPASVCLFFQYERTKFKK